MNIISDLKDTDTEILQGEYLKKHTTFSVGGQADYFIYVRSLPSLCKTVKYLNENNTEYFIIGDGTNLLVTDSDIHKVFIKLEGDFSKIAYNDCFVTCGSACHLSQVAKDTLSKGLGGLETIGSVPGTIGGASIMNAGVRYFDFSSYVHEIGAVDRNGNQVIFPKEKCGYSYRESIFQHTDEYIITHAVLKLEKCDTEPLWKKLNASIEKRKTTQPKGKCAGCFFKNSDNRSSGKLIEECGLKGLSINDAYVAAEHGNFIMNRGNATFDDIISLAEKVKEEVKKQKGFDLVYEVRIVR